MPSNQTLLLTATTFLTILGAIYIFSSPNPTNPPTMASQNDATTIPALQFQLSQISRSPPSLLITLKNTSPTPYTLLKWGTPLDPSAPNTGIFKVVDADSGEELNTDFIKVGRKMPPGESDVVTVAPGTEEATEVVFDKPWMPEKKPAKYRVWVEGSFTGVWARERKEVKEGDLLAYTESEGWEKGFRSDEVAMLVE